jgi:hypothetical protein
MAFTRGYDDKNRVEQSLKKETDICKYMLNVPGNGIKPYYIDDPHIRLQKFGGNISHNIVDVNSGLLGIAGPLDSQCRFKQDKNEQMIKNNYTEMMCPVEKDAISDESRSTMPAWQLRDLEQNNWNYLHFNPQAHSQILFDNNLSSRILEKDNYNSTCKR